MNRTILALATLAALGLAAQPIARAQSLSLNSNDAVTVSGTGTVGTVGGTPVANTTKSYSTSSGTVVQTNGTSTFTLTTGGTITAGDFGTGLFANGSGLVTVSGGTFAAGQFGIGLDAFGSGPVTVTGGTFTAGLNGAGLDAFGSGPVTVTGGTFTAGTGGDGLAAKGSGTINLFGSFVGYAPGMTTLTNTGSFVGTLTNNTAAQTFTYSNINGGKIILNNAAPVAAPEPSQFAAFAIGLLGLGALALRARRRTA